MRGILGTGRGREAWRWTERAAPQAVWAFMSLPLPLHLGALPGPTAKLRRPGHHFLFFSFASLASSASWSLMSCTLFRPSGVLKYQSWGRGGKRQKGECIGAAPCGPAS